MQFKICPLQFLFWFVVFWGGGTQEMRCSSGVDSHEIVISVINGTTDSCIPFCNAFARKTQKGFMADDRGIITVKRQSLTENDSLTCSSIGYKDSIIALNLALLPDTLIIRLRPKTYPLGHVTVLPPKKTKILKKGKRHDSGMFLTVLNSAKGSTVAWETGRKKRRTWLKSVRIQSLQFPIRDDSSPKDSLAQPAGESPLYPLTSPIRFRINIYDAADKKSQESGWVLTDCSPVNHQPIIFCYDIVNLQDDIYEFSLEEPLLLPELALVEIEQLDDFPAGERIFYKSNMFGKSILGREIDDLCWSKLPLSTPFTLILLEEKF